MHDVSFLIIFGEYVTHFIFLTYLYITFAIFRLPFSTASGQERKFNGIH